MFFGKLIPLLLLLLNEGSNVTVKRRKQVPCKGTVRTCTCRNEIAWCKSLTYVPIVPKYVRVLVLIDNTIPSVDKGTFQNVSRNKLKKLVLNNNKIETISNDAFSDINTIKVLVVGHERKLNLTKLKESFKSLNQSIVTELIFENNGWLSTQIPENFLKFMKGGNLSKVKFTGNNFNDFDFMRLDLDNSAKWLNMSDNEMVFIQTRGLQFVTKLYLAVNNIFEIPDFCENGTQNSLAPRLEYLSLSDNAIRKLAPTSFRCLKRLERLILDRNRLNVIEDYVFTSLPSLSKLFISWIPQLGRLQRHAFDHPSLEELLFTQNGFRFDKMHPNNLTYLFANMSNLQRLDLRRNYLPKESKHLCDLFHGLKRIKKLVLPSTYITVLPSGLFQGMPLLEHLELGGNRIKTWHFRTFENLTSLRTLLLDGNYIHVINESSFPANFLVSLEQIDLSHNDFWCTCQQKWFVDYIRATNLTKKLKNWPRYYSCIYPNDKKGLTLDHYAPTDDDCADWSPIFTIIIVILTGVFIVFVVLLVAFSCIANIRNTIYLLRTYSQIRKGYIKLSSADDFQYDAYVVYCDADRVWVHNVLLKNLETCGLNICIRLRDFEFGEHIADNIEKYMKCSWKVIVVMSNNFTKSEWCQWEIDLVQERRRQDGKRALVLIMYCQIDSGHMINSIRALLDTTPYLQYKEGFGEQMFWSAITKAVRKPLAHPPTALLD